MTLEFSVTGLHCESCGLLIDDAVEAVAGVQSSQTTRRSGRTIVRVVDPSRVTVDAIVAAITAAGYSAEACTEVD